jgi:hypothetical protein
MIDEVLPELYVWSAFHEGIEARVHSAYYVRGRTLIDPLLPEDGAEALDELPAPERIVLTNRHHYRHSDALAERFSCPVFCHARGLHAFGDGRQVEGYSFGDRLAEGATTLDFSSITPEEAALALDSGPGVLAFGDGLRREDDGSLSFMSDELLGEDPEAVKDGLRRELSAMLERPFDAMIFAHAAPILSGARAELSAFLA